MAHQAPPNARQPRSYVRPRVPLCVLVLTFVWLRSMGAFAEPGAPDFPMGAHPFAWTDPHTIVSPELNRPVSEDELSLQPGENTSEGYFSALVASVVRLIKTGKDAHRPRLCVVALGGGADVASASATKNWFKDCLVRHPTVRQAYREAFGEALDLDRLTKHQLLRIITVELLERRVSHADRAYGVDGENPAFYQGSRVDGAGLPPEVKGGRPIDVRDEKGQLTRLKHVTGATLESRFQLSANDFTGSKVVFCGTPLEDAAVLDYVREPCGLEELVHLSMRGTIGETRREVALFLQDYTRVGGNGADEPSTFAPLFGMTINPGADNAEHSRQEFRPNIVVSAVNEAFMRMVMRPVVEGTGPAALLVPGRWLMNESHFTRDNETDDVAGNRIIGELRRKGAVVGAIDQVPAWTAREVLVRLLGYGDEPAKLASNCNRASLVADVRRRARTHCQTGSRGGAVTAVTTLDDYLDALPPLETVAWLPGREDIPMDGKVPISVGDLTSVRLLFDPKRTNAYLDGSAKTSAVDHLRHGDLRRQREIDQMVTGENQLPEGDYELGKAAMAMGVPRFWDQVADALLLAAVPRDERASFAYLPKSVWPDQRTLGTLKVRKLGHALGSLDRPRRLALELARRHAQRLVADALDPEAYSTGILRLNVPYLLARLVRDHPNLHESLTGNIVLAEKIVATVRQLYGRAFFEMLQEIDGRTGLQSLEQALQGGVDPRGLDHEDLQKASMILHILRINPHSGRVLYQHRNNSISRRFRERITRLQVSAIEFQLRKKLRPRNRLRTRRDTGQEPVVPPSGVSADSADIIRGRRLRQLRRYVRKVGLDSGSYEKLAKSLSDLVLLNLFLKRPAAARESAVLLYSILPEHLPSTGKGRQPLDPFNNLRDMKAYHRLARVLNALQKRQPDFFFFLEQLIAEAAGDKLWSRNADSFLQGMRLAALANRAPELMHREDVDQIPDDHREALRQFVMHSKTRLEQKQKALGRFFAADDAMNAETRQLTRPEVIWALVDEDVHRTGESRTGESRREALGGQYGRILATPWVPKGTRQRAERRFAHLGHEVEVLTRLADHLGQRPNVRGTRIGPR